MAAWVDGGIDRKPANLRTMLTKVRFFLKKNRKTFLRIEKNPCDNAHVQVNMIKMSLLSKSVRRLTLSQYNSRKASRSGFFPLLLFLSFSLLGTWLHSLHFKKNSQKLGCSFKKMGRKNYLEDTVRIILSDMKAK